MVARLDTQQFGDLGELVRLQRVDRDQTRRADRQLLARRRGVCRDALVEAGTGLTGVGMSH
jgi:hypothetical protein